MARQRVKFALKRVAAGLLLAGLATSALADPGSALLAVASITAEAVATKVFLTIAALAYGSARADAEQRRARAEQRRLYNAGLADRPATLLRTAPSARYVYGETVTGGDIVAMFHSNKTGVRDDGTTFTRKDAYIHLVVHFASHECADITDVLVDGSSVGSLDGSGWVTMGTASGATTNAAGYAKGATSITLASAGTGTILAGDYVQFAGSSAKYRVVTGDSDVSSGGTIVLETGLTTAIAASATAITVSNPFVRRRKIRRSLTIADGANVVLDYPMTVLRAVINPASGEDQLQTATYSLSNGNKTITNTTAGQTIVVDVYYTDVVASVRVGKHLGTDDQTVDTYLNGLLPSKWTTNHRLRGLTYIVLTLDLENPAFQSPVTVQARVKGKAVYDHRINTVPNTYYDGAVVGGSAGTSKAFGGLPSGVTSSVAAVGVEDGMPYVDVRTVGTPSASGTALIYTFGSSANGAAAAVGETWKAGYNARTVAGTLPNVARVYIIERDSGGTSLASSYGEYTVASMAAATSIARNRMTHSRVLSNASTAKVQVALYVPLTSGVAVDFTVRHGLATLSKDNDAVGWNDNNALCIRDWLVSPLGPGCDYTDVNETYCTAAANECDTTRTIYLRVFGVLVPITTKKRFTFNGTVDSSMDREALLDQMADSMAGWVHQDAEWLMLAGDKDWTTVQDLGPDDLDGSISVLQSGSPSSGLFNGVRGQFIAAGEANPKDYPPYQNAAFKAEDGVDLWKDLSLPFTDNAFMAKTVARIITERERNGLVVQFPAKLSALGLQVGDRVRVTNTEMGFVNKVFRVTGWEFNVKQPVQLTLQEDATTAYDDTDEADADPTPNTTNPSPFEMPDITGLTLTSSSATQRRTADGTVVPRVLVEWDSYDGPYTADGSGYIMVKWQRFARDQPTRWRTMRLPGDAKSTYIEGFVEGDGVTVGVWAVNGLRTPSDVSYAHTTASAEVFGGALVNLVKNSSFEVDTDGNGVPNYWTQSSFGTNINISTTLDTDSFHNKKALKLTVNSVTNPSSQTSHSRFAAANEDSLGRVVPDQWYIASGMFKTNNLAFKARLSIVWLDAAFATVGTSYVVAKALTQTGKYERVWGVPVQAPAGAVYGRLSAGIERPSVNDVTTGYMLVDAVGLVNARSLTPYILSEMDSNMLLPNAAAYVMSAFDSYSTVTRTLQTAAYDLDVLYNAAIYTNETAEDVLLLISCHAEAAVSVSSGGSVFAQAYFGHNGGELLSPPIDTYVSDQPGYTVNSAGGEKRWNIDYQLVTVAAPGEGVMIFARLEAGPVSGSQTWVQTLRNVSVSYTQLKSS